MLQRVRQLSAGKHATSQLVSVANVMQQLSLALTDPHRLQAVMNDLGRNVLAADLVQLVPLKSVDMFQGWVCVPPNAKVSECDCVNVRVAHCRTSCCHGTSKH